MSTTQDQPPPGQVTMLDEAEGLFILEETNRPDPLVFLMRADVEPEGTDRRMITWEFSLGGVPDPTDGELASIHAQHRHALDRVRNCHVKLEPLGRAGAIGTAEGTIHWGLTGIGRERLFQRFDHVTIAAAAYPGGRGNLGELTEFPYTGHGISTGNNWGDQWGTIDKSRKDLTTRLRQLHTTLGTSPELAAYRESCFPTGPTHALSLAQRERRALEARVADRRNPRRTRTRRRIRQEDERLGVLRDAEAHLADQIT